MLAQPGGTLQSSETMRKAVLSAGVAAVTLTALPASASSEDVLAALVRIEANLRHSSYTHATRVDERAGSYEFDCSGMAAWVLRRASPLAHNAVVSRSKNGRPLARDYYHQIALTRPGPARYGWSRVPRVADANPGDVIAWLRPKEVRSANTGHVAFLVTHPVPVARVPNAYLVRIADASRYQHQDDTRAGSGRTGYGRGTIVVMADPETGAPVAYGWVGLRSAWILRTSMALGRPVG
jgi:hypothetical protein